MAEKLSYLHSRSATLMNWVYRDNAMRHPYVFEPGHTPTANRADAFIRGMQNPPASEVTGTNTADTADRWLKRREIVVFLDTYTNHQAQLAARIMGQALEYANGTSIDLKDFHINSFTKSLHVMESEILEIDELPENRLEYSLSHIQGTSSADTAESEIVFQGVTHALVVQTCIDDASSSFVPGHGLTKFLPEFGMKVLELTNPTPYPKDDKEIRRFEENGKLKIVKYSSERDWEITNMLLNRLEKLLLDEVNRKTLL